MESLSHPFPFPQVGGVSVVDDAAETPPQTKGGFFRLLNKNTLGGRSDRVKESSSGIRAEGSDWIVDWNYLRLSPGATLCLLESQMRKMRGWRRRGGDWTPETSNFKKKKMKLPCIKGTTEVRDRVCGFCLTPHGTSPFCSFPLQESPF